MSNTNMIIKAEKPVPERAVKHFQNVVAETGTLMVKEAMKQNSGFVEGEGLTEFEGRYFATSFAIELPSMKVENIIVTELSQDKWLDIINMRQNQKDIPSQKTGWFEIHDED